MSIRSSYLGFDPKNNFLSVRNTLAYYSNALIEPSCLSECGIVDISLEHLQISWVSYLNGHWAN
jgi:hypothetical protein